jgi:hypothetical protein
MISTHSKDFCGKIALIRQISKIKISNQSDFYSRFQAPVCSQ